MKIQKIRLTNIFTIETFIFANFVQKVDFDRSHLQNVGVALAEFHLSELSSYAGIRGKLF